MPRLFHWEGACNCRIQGSRYTCRIKRWGNLSFNGCLVDRVLSLKDGDRSRVWEQLYASRAIESSGRTYSLTYLFLVSVVDAVRLGHLSTRYTWPTRNLWNSEQVQRNWKRVWSDYNCDVVRGPRPGTTTRSYVVRPIAKSKCVEDWYSERLIGCQTVSLISPAKSCSIKEYERANRGNVRSSTHGRTGERDLREIYSPARCLDWLIEKFRNSKTFF